MHRYSFNSAASVEAAVNQLVGFLGTGILCPPDMAVQLGSTGRQGEQADTSRPVPGLECFLEPSATVHVDSSRR